MAVPTSLASAYVDWSGTPIGSMLLSPTHIIAELDWLCAAGGSRGVSGRDDAFPVSDDNPVLEHLELEGREPEVLPEAVRSGAESRVGTMRCCAKRSTGGTSKDGESNTTAGGESRARKLDARVGVTGGVANTIGSSSEDIDISADPSGSIFSTEGG